MNVGINLLFLKPGLAGGTETYSMNLLRAIARRSDINITFYIFCSSELNLDFLEALPNFKIVRYKKVSRSLSYRFLFEQFIFPFRLKSYKLSVLHSHGYVGPIFISNQIVTIHDTNAFEHKGAMPLPKRLLLSFFLKAISKKCEHIIAVSQFSKNEIIKHLSISPKKISVIYEACKYTNPINAEANLLATPLGEINGDYFMGLSSLSPHKNIQTLIAAFKLIATEYPKIKLVLAGHLSRNINTANIYNDVELREKIIITGFVDDYTLAHLFENAICFVFPSLYEGFGLPLLEAQNAGVPVIASDRGSLPEIGQDSALYFPAKDAVTLSREMKKLLLDKNKRKIYINLGLENVKRFSWDKAADETLNVYYKCSKNLFYKK